MPRGVDQYLEELDRRAHQGSFVARSTASDAKQGGGDEDGLSQKELRELKKQRTSLERKMGTLRSKLDKAKGELLKIDGTDFVALGQQQEKISGLEAELEELEDSWLEIAEQLEG